MNSFVPTARFFYDHLLVVLGRLTNHTPYHYVYFASVVTETLREAGFDPDNLPEGLSRTGTCGDGGPHIDRRVGFAFRNQRAKYCGARTPMTVQGGHRLWGLTEAGVERALALQAQREVTTSPVAVPPPDSDRKPKRNHSRRAQGGSGTDRPTASYFMEAVIKTIASMTGYVSNSPVDHTECSLNVLRSMGFDPNALPEGWELYGRDGVMRRIHFAWRNQQHKYTGKGRKKGQWTLTEEGVERARFLTGVFEPLLEGLAPTLPTPQPEVESPAKVAKTPALAEPEIPPATPPSGDMNLTAKWISTKGLDLIEALRAAITKKLAISAQMDLVEDHVNNFLMKLIARDSLRKYIEAGESIPTSKMSSWAVRSSYTDIRGWGTDASCREIRGARTEQNRRAMAAGERDWSHEWVQSATSRAILSEDSGGQAYLTDVVDTSDNTSEMEARHDFEVNVWSQIEGIFREDFPSETDRYLRVTRMLMEGFKPKDVARVEHISREDASSLIADVRRSLRDAHAEGLFFPLAAVE